MMLRQKKKTISYYFIAKKLQMLVITSEEFSPVSRDEAQPRPSKL